MCKNTPNSDTIHYCTILSAGQWNFLLEGRYSNLRLKCLHRLMTDAVRTRTAYKIKGIDIVLEVGQAAASDVELAAYLECNRKTVGKLIDSFNRLGMLTTRTNNRTSVHSLHFLTGWYVGGVLIANPHYVRPSAVAKGQTGIARTPVPNKSESENERSVAVVDSRSEELNTDSMATGAALLSSSLSLADGSAQSYGMPEDGNRQRLSVSCDAEEPGNPHIIDSINGASGENVAGSHSEAQDGTDGSEDNPAQTEG